MVALLTALVVQVVDGSEVTATEYALTHPEDGRSYLVELTRRGVATNVRNSRRLECCLARLA